MCLFSKKYIKHLLCSLIFTKVKDQRTHMKFKIENKKDIILWVNNSLDSICQLSPLQKRMMIHSCNRIINSYIETFRIRKRLWKEVAISTIWLVIKAYGIDEEEEQQWIDAKYMNELCPEVSREKIIILEMMIFKHINYQVIGPEKDFFKSYNKN